MTQIEQILAKIEQLKVDYVPKVNIEYREFAKYLLDLIIEDINSLYAKQSSNDLEEEINHYFKDDKWFSTSLGDIARYFANWQKEQDTNRACEWLRNHVLEYFDNAGVEIDTFTENFIIAMGN